jgi:endoglucanase
MLAVGRCRGPRVAAARRPALADRRSAQGLARSAGAAGLRVVLDLHNFGGHYLHDGTVGVRRAIRSPELPVSAFADVWRRITTAFAEEPAVWAFGLMNEPTGLPSTAELPAARLWEQASQAALTAIRDTGERRRVAVAGYDWSSMATWARNHPRGWVRDPARNVMYEAHHYWNSTGSGVYLSYNQELALAS